MAKAKAECTCSKCGEIFIKEKMCRNRNEADNWESWAPHHFNLCGRCYSAQKKKEEIEKGLYFDVRLDPGYAISDEPECVTIVFGGDTLPYKESIKKIGARWTDYYPSDDVFSSLLSTQLPKFKWVIRCTPDDLFDKIKLSKSIGATLNSMPSDVDMTLLANLVAEKNKAAEIKDIEMQKELDAIGEFPKFSPDVADLMPENVRWNGRFYGIPGKWTIYLSGEPVSITDKQKESLENTKEKRDAWLKEKKSINHKYGKTY